jgi:hypothetical protein
VPGSLGRDAEHCRVYFHAGRDPENRDVGVEVGQRLGDVGRSAVATGEQNQVDAVVDEGAHRCAGVGSRRLRLTPGVAHHRRFEPCFTGLLLTHEAAVHQQFHVLTTPGQRAQGVPAARGCPHLRAALAGLLDLAVGPF